ncbi:MAG: DNA repair protein RecO [Roseburia sp.]|nr:DNA repair protein RecO [Roseburia sp.]
MGQAVRVMGMVLSAMPVGDYDKRITVLTYERGKITAFARGARRPGSQLMAATEPFSFGEFELFEGKSSYNVKRADIKNYFRELVADLEAMSLGFYFMEFAEYYCQENNDEREFLKLLYQSMRALESPKFPRALVRAVFELRAMAINGEGPDLFSCMCCGGREALCLFSVKRGGMLCKKCGQGAPGREILDSTRYAMQFIISTPVERLYTFSLSEEVQGELTKVLKEYMDFYVHHEFKSLGIHLTDSGKNG